jgi:ubiquinone/menaquinone biosynthesis C-methylase UbiE
VKPKDKVLDVACGNGKLLEMLYGKCPIVGYGVDISEKMIENAGMKCPGMTFAVSGCEKTPFDSEMFDVVTVCAAYHHFPDPKAFAKEAFRLLKPRGLLYIAEVYYPPAARVVMNLIMPFSKAGDVRLYSAHEIEENFAGRGFERIGSEREENVQIISMRRL